MSETKLELISNLKKPAGAFTERFRSRKEPSIEGLESLLNPLPILKIGDTNDFVRVHPNEATHWTPPLCFVSVPIPKDKKDILHVIDEELAAEYLATKRIKRMRLALASKPHDVFIFIAVPVDNLANSWNVSALGAIEHAKTKWTQATSRKAEGIEGYKVTFSQDIDAFPDPRWPNRSIDDLLEITFKGAMIEDINHPAMRRLVGIKQELK
jgi:hypothetical protein